MSIADNIANNLAAVRARIQAATLPLRPPAQLVAVSKRFPVAALEQAAAAGQVDFGENYVQEALPKIAAHPEWTWHFIGPIQSNKTRAIAEHFAWVHSVENLRIAQRLSDQRPAHLPPLKLCVQVNTSGEASKSGCAPNETLALCAQIKALPRLDLQGLMTLPEAGFGETGFALLADLARQANLTVLSMGMSDDLEAAIAHGATHVRVGSAIFGTRLAAGAS